MKKMPVAHVLKRAELADSRKDLWRSIYEECYEFALPQRNLYSGQYEGKTPGQHKRARVFDSTAINSTQRFANRIQSGLFPPYRKWMQLTPGSDIPKDRRKEVADALDIYSDKFFEILRQTNFDLAISEMLLDMAVGTGVMLIMPGDKDTPVRFTAVPQYLVSFEEGQHGTVDNVYRKLRVKGEAITTQWKDAKIPADLQVKIDRKPEEEIDLLEATIFNYSTGAVCYYVLEPKGKNELVYRELKKSSPWVVGRYMKVAGEVYGRGPLVNALPDIKTLNKVKELLLKNASISVAGVYTAADDGVLNPATIKIAPGAIIPVARNGGPQGESLRPLRSGGDFNVSQLVINDLVNAIKKMLLDDTLPPDTMSARSATEVAERMKELAQNIGPAYGRLITEVMQPIVRRTMEVLDEMGIIDFPLKVDGTEVKVVPTGSLAQAQNMQEVNDVLQFVQVAGQVGLGAQLAINQEELADYLADRLGVPSYLINSKEQRQAIMAQMAQAAQMAQTAQQGGAEQPQAQEV